MIAGRRVGAAKLDLALRGLALEPRHAGKRGLPGFVLRKYSYEDLHDLVRRPLYDGDATDPSVIRLKRKWVADQLTTLETRNLVRREGRPGLRPDLVVLRDDGSGDPFDEVGGSASYYLVIPGGVVASGALADWGAPELAFFLAALIAERREANRRASHQKGYVRPDIGGGDWFQPLYWFADRPGKRQDRGERFPFSESTLERGLARFLELGLVKRTHAYRDPLTKRKFRSGRRNVYSNRFHLLNLISGSNSPDDLKQQIKKAIQT